MLRVEDVTVSQVSGMIAAGVFVGMRILKPFLVKWALNMLTLSMISSDPHTHGLTDNPSWAPQREKLQRDCLGGDMVRWTHLPRLATSHCQS